MLEIWIYTNKLKGSNMLQGIRDFHVSIFERASINQQTCVPDMARTVRLPSKIVYAKKIWQKQKRFEAR